MSPDGRHLLRLARRRLGGLVSRIWELSFRHIVPRPSQEPATWQPDPGGADEGPVLVITPHPDDETAGCGGTLALHSRAGHRVTVACMTDGTGSRALRGTPADRSARRRSELEAAMSMLGLDPARSLAWLGLPEGRWELTAGSAAIRELLEQLRPSTLYAPSRIDFHPEHIKVATAVASALGQSGREPLIRIFPAQVPLSSPPANLHVDVSQLGRVVEQALRAHASQWGSVRCTLRRRRYAAALAGRSGLVEELWQLDAEAYRRLHEHPGPKAEKLRGLRFDPWLDPLCFLVGRRARARLACLAQGTAGSIPGPQTPRA